MNQCSRSSFLNKPDNAMICDPLRIYFSLWVSRRRFFKAIEGDGDPHCCATALSPHRPTESASDSTGYRLRSSTDERTSGKRFGPPPVIIPPRGEPIEALSRRELARLEEEEDEAKHARSS